MNHLDNAIKLYKSNKVKTYLPIFGGFYDTQFSFEYNWDYITEFINNERKEKGLYSDFNENDIQIDYKAYENDIALSLCEVIKNELSDYINDIEFESIYNPKAYNFQNDSINVIIDVNVENIKNFIYTHKIEFEKYLKSKYTSYDGFISHYDNDFQSWESITENFTNYNANGYMLGSILEFIADILKIDNYTLYSDIFESVDVLFYIENLEDVINYTDNSLYEFLTSHKIIPSIADYITVSYNNNVIKNLCLSENILSLINEFEYSINK